MTTWSFYKLDTGLFTGRSSSARALGRVPDGCGAVVGRYDRLTQRVDTATGEVVAYDPPPDVVEALRRRRARRDARVVIAAAEIAQARAVREGVLALLPLLPASPQKADMIARLQQIEDQIAARRGDL